jgi:hypothetical protein
MNTTPESSITFGPVSPDETERRWTAIPDYTLGNVPENLSEEEPLLYRRIVAKRAIFASYEETDFPEQCIKDLLIDLRHLCDGLGLDFAAIDRRAYETYSAEKAEAAL